MKPSHFEWGGAVDKCLRVFGLGIVLVLKENEAERLQMSQDKPNGFKEICFFLFVCCKFYSPSELKKISAHLMMHATKITLDIKGALLRS